MIGAAAQLALTGEHEIMIRVPVPAASSSISCCAQQKSDNSLSRGQALRQIVDSPEVQTKYFNQAYAVMEYFGYLRREPDSFYLDWIQVLNSTGDARGMVTGFVNSIEYRQRFGPP